MPEGGVQVYSTTHTHVRQERKRETENVSRMVIISTIIQSITKEMVVSFCISFPTERTTFPTNQHPNTEITIPFASKLKINHKSFNASK